MGELAHTTQGWVFGPLGSESRGRRASRGTGGGEKGRAAACCAKGTMFSKEEETGVESRGGNETMHGNYPWKKDKGGESKGDSTGNVTTCRNDNQRLSRGNEP